MVFILNVIMKDGQKVSLQGTYLEAIQWSFNMDSGHCTKIKLFFYTATLETYIVG